MPSSSRRSGRSGRSGRPARTGRGRPKNDPGSSGYGAGDGTDGQNKHGHHKSEDSNAGHGAAAQGKGNRRGTGRNQRRGQRRIRTVDETSAGGLVVDTDTGRAALIGRIDRRGRLLWSLPKGHIESGETAEQAAVREVAEETGIAGVVLAPLGTIDYWFVAEDRRVHKTVHHFLLRAVGGELSDNDPEVTEVAWVALDELETRLAYADERRLVRRADELLAEAA